MNVAAQNSPFKAQGRISRITFFAWNTVLTMVLVVPLIAIALWIPNLSETLIQNNIVLLALILSTLSILLLYFKIIFSIKRLHDLNYSGWLVLFDFIPLVNFFFTLCVVFAPGMTGPNTFGEQPNPKTWESVVTWMMVGLFSLGVIIAIFSRIFMQ